MTEEENLNWWRNYLASLSDEDLKQQEYHWRTWANGNYEMAESKRNNALHAEFFANANDYDDEGDSALKLANIAKEILEDRGKNGQNKDI